MKEIYTVSTYTPRLIPPHKIFSPSVRRYYLPILAVVQHPFLVFHWLDLDTKYRAGYTGIKRYYIIGGSFSGGYFD